MPAETDSNHNPFPLSHEDRLRLIEENVRDYAIFTLTPDGKVASWNVGAERILGFTEAEVLGMEFFHIFTAEDRDIGVPKREMEIAGSVGRAEDERWHLRKDGSRFWASGILTALRDTENKDLLHGFVKILRDNTPSKTAQIRIEELNIQLRDAMTEIHHRVKNNLQVIAAMLDIQMMEYEESMPISEAKRLAEQIRTLSIVHDILTQQVQQANPNASISVQSVFDRLLPNLAKAAGHDSFECRIADVPVSVKQATSLALIVAELISNALKHGQGWVEVTLEASGEGNVLEVCNDGDGFPADFDPTTSANTGLMLIDTLVRYDMRGTVVFENFERGARVRVSFPSPDASAAIG
ncbi:MAG: signal transduction histidine kinase [Chthonomonadaceae bacterium]|nr:signal transduction histidine kinase [Chthonomonadaceae bacterium]